MINIFSNVPKETIFLKKTSNLEVQRDVLKELLSEISDSKQKEYLEFQLKLIEMGIVGEERVIYELKNSHIPMIVLRDVHLKFGELKGQIDFLVFTEGFHYVIECKNLIGDIQIDGQGNFIRKIPFKNKVIRQGIYSPVTQNRRHLDLIKAIVEDKIKHNILKRLNYDQKFENTFRSLVVLAQDKLVLNLRYTPKEVKDVVIKHDQLGITMKKQNAASIRSFGKQNWKLRVSDVAEKWLEKNTEDTRDYKKLWVERLNQKIEQAQTSENETSTERKCPRCGGLLVERVVRRGENKGNKIFGCSNFPKCRYIQSA